VGDPGQCLEPARRDRSTAAEACAIRAGIQAGEGCIDQLELLDRPIAQREITLLRKDLAGRGRLRSVRHLPGCDDRLTEFRHEALTISLERIAGRGSIRGVHRRTLRFGGQAAHRPVYSQGVPVEDASDMAIAIDPVCGMEVDTTTTTLSLEHDGTTYWFCGKGCLLDFQDDPERYLDEDYTPSM
jgi:YHS domain-containing protein